MLKHRFRHLPIIGGSSNTSLNSSDSKIEVKGLLDITSLMASALISLERAAASGEALVNAVHSVARNWNIPPIELARLGSGLLNLVSPPTLAEVISSTGKDAIIVRGDTPIQHVATMMRLEEATAVVIVELNGEESPKEGGGMKGIFTTKDCVARVLANEVDFQTRVDDVATHNPDFVHGGVNVIEALRRMHGKLIVIT